MRIRTLDLVEDSNRFTLAQLEGCPQVTPYTVPGSARPILVDGELVGVARVDRFPRDIEIDLPPKQALALINKGLAEPVPLSE